MGSRGIFKEDYLRYFLFGVSWIFFSFLLASRFPVILLQQIREEKEPKDKIYRVLIENKTPPKKEKRRDTVRFLSKERREARGKITPEKGFWAWGKREAFSWGSKPSQVELKKIIKTPLKRKAPLLKNPLKIPAHYRFRREFALSWDRKGFPQIPTVYWKHYEYFKKMLRKIQDNWAPPGGRPYPTYADAYKSLGYVPGYFQVKPFPSQDVYVVFSLDKEGNVGDVKVVKSLGYKMLDEACKDAIIRSKNFSPPPKELLQNGVLYVPIIFRIIVP